MARFCIGFFGSETGSSHSVLEILEQSYWGQSRPAHQTENFSVRGSSATADPAFPEEKHSRQRAAYQDRRSDEEIITGLGSMVSRTLTHDHDCHDDSYHPSILSEFDCKPVQRRPSRRYRRVCCNKLINPDLLFRDFPTYPTNGPPAVLHDKIFRLSVTSGPNSSRWDSRTTDLL